MEVGKVDIGRRDDIGRDSGQRNKEVIIAKPREESRKTTDTKRDIAPNTSRDVKTGTDNRTGERDTKPVTRNTTTPRVEERKNTVPERQVVTPEKRENTRETRVREVAPKTGNNERKQEVKENRTERSRQPETKTNTEDIKRVERKDAPEADRRTR